MAVNEAYDGSGLVYDFFQKIYERNSIDNRGLRLDSTVHYGRDYDNAFWTGRGKPTGYKLNRNDAKCAMNLLAYIAP